MSEYTNNEMDKKAIDTPATPVTNRGTKNQAQGNEGDVPTTTTNDIDLPAPEAPYPTEADSLLNMTDKEHDKNPALMETEATGGRTDENTKPVMNEIQHDKLLVPNPTAPFVTNTVANNITAVTGATPSEGENENVLTKSALDHHDKEALPDPPSPEAVQDSSVSKNAPTSDGISNNNPSGASYDNATTTAENTAITQEQPIQVPALPPLNKDDLSLANPTIPVATNINDTAKSAATTEHTSNNKNICIADPLPAGENKKRSVYEMQGTDSDAAVENESESNPAKEDAKTAKKLKKTTSAESTASNLNIPAAGASVNPSVTATISYKKRASYAYASPSNGPAPTWNDMFFALMAFKAKLGNFNVPGQTKLGKWVAKQRQEYSKLQRKKIRYESCTELSEERIQVLDSLGFIWDTMLHENGRRWQQRFEELKKWKEEHGHCNVPQSTSLGQWVKIQRENKREADLKAAGKLPQRTKPKPCLAPERVEKLNSIGFQWRVAAPITGWDNRYQQLLEYAKAHNGDVNVPQYYPADKAFGRWVMKQRSEYSLRLRGLKSQLTDERVEKLNAIGFSWVAPNFKRKVGVGIAPGSPAANVAAAAMQGNNTTAAAPSIAADASIAAPVPATPVAQQTQAPKAAPSAPAPPPTVPALIHHHHPPQGIPQHDPYTAHHPPPPMPPPPPQTYEHNPHQHYQNAHHHPHYPMPYGQTPLLAGHEGYHPSITQQHHHDPYGGAPIPAAMATAPAQPPNQQQGSTEARQQELQQTQQQSDAPSTTATEEVVEDEVVNMEFL